MTDVLQLSFEERLANLIDREEVYRNNQRSKRRLSDAKLRERALFEDIDWSSPRDLDKSVMLSLSSCEWIRQHQNVIFCGPTGTGKTWLACALAHRACLEGLTSKFIRIPRLFGELNLAKSDGSYPKVMAKLAKINLLIFDDWGQPLNENQRRDFLEIIEDRTGSGSSIITTQIPVKNWHQIIGDPTLADAILDRIIHRSHSVDLSGDSLRKKHFIRKNNG